MIWSDVWFGSFLFLRHSKCLPRAIPYLNSLALMITPCSSLIGWELKSDHKPRPTVAILTLIPFSGKIRSVACESSPKKEHRDIFTQEIDDLKVNLTDGQMKNLSRVSVGSRYHCLDVVLDVNTEDLRVSLLLLGEALQRDLSLCSIFNTVCESNVGRWLHQRKI